MKVRERYNGWHNRATWNVVLWVGNEEGTYKLARDAARRNKFNAKSAEEFARELYPNGATPDGDSLSDVHWPEVARAFNEYR